MDPHTLLWFALSVFRVADKIGIDGHVSFLSHPKKKKKKRGFIACLDGLPRLLCTCRLRRKGLATRQSQAYPASAGGPPLMYPLDVTQVVMRRWRAGVRGRIDPRIGIGAGAPACLRRQACSRPSQSHVLSTPFFFFFFFGGRKKAYMPIDESQFEREIKQTQKSVSTAHPMTREAASPCDVRYELNLTWGLPRTVPEAGVR